MRTTLEIDEVVLSAARARAAARHVSLGAAVSEIALEALGARPGTTTADDGFPVIHAAPDHVITDEMAAEHRDDE